MQTNKLDKAAREEASRLASMLRSIELGMDDENARMLINTVLDRIPDLYHRIWRTKNGEIVKQGNVSYVYNHDYDSVQYPNLIKERGIMIDGKITMESEMKDNQRGYTIESSSLVLKLVCKDGSIIYEEQKL